MASVQVSVVAVLDGQRHCFSMQMDGSTLIQAADAAGVELPTQCRAGVCATCQARLLRGQVRMLENVGLDDAEVAAGYILACQSIPLTDDIEIEFVAS
jgi:ring-1,2-phenylacetyl-CoA epoxidase subunit PaaE